MLGCVQVKLRLPEATQQIRFRGYLHAAMNGGCGFCSNAVDIAIDDIFILAMKVAVPPSVAVHPGHQLHMCVVAFGLLKCFGHNDDGQLGYGHVENLGDDPLEVGVGLPTVNLGSEVVEACVGHSHSCAMLREGRLKCWGNGHYGQHGGGSTATIGDEPNEVDERLPAVNLGSGAKVAQIACGFHHTCAVLHGGTVKCFGSNEWGQLGLGDTQLGPQSELQVEACCGSCILCASASLWLRNRGTASHEMGDALPAVNLGNARITQLVLGYLCTCALSEAGKVLCWGRLTPGAPVLGNEPGEMGDQLPVLDFGLPVTQLAAGWYHVCALLSDGRVRCWGGNPYGQLGLGDTVTRLTPVSDVDLGTGMMATKIAAGGHHSCAVLQDETLQCWGWNTYGQLGVGHTNNIGDNSGEMGDALVRTSAGRVHAAHPGGKHTCALQTDEAMFCFGYGNSGTLGLGRTDHVGDNPDELGGAALLPPLFLPQTPGQELEQVRLSSASSSDMNGWLEVLHNGSSALICDDGFDVAAATVACKDRRGKKLTCAGWKGLEASFLLVYASIKES